ncbi:MAG: DinB family protein [Planctomycetota bacterium]
MSRIVSRRPSDQEIPTEYLGKLIRYVQGDCVLEALSGQQHWLCELAGSISTEQVDRVHPPYQWTVRQVVEHCVDVERLFGHRIMCLASGGLTDLPQWDENVAADSRFGLGHFSHLITELGALRQANTLLLDRIGPRVWENTGQLSGNSVSVRLLAWVMAGHLHHHLQIIEQRCNVTVGRGPIGPS